MLGMTNLTTKGKLVEAAQALMLSKGYAATTVDEICEQAGVSKGSFYHFFETKEELGLAVVEAFQARNDRLVAEGLQTQLSDPVEQSLALLDHLIASAGELWGSGCLLGTFALDLADTNPTICDAVSAKFEAVAGRLAEGLQPLFSGGSPEDARSAKELSEQFIIVVEGALILAKAHKDWSYVDRALERFRNDVRRSVGVPA